MQTFVSTTSKSTLKVGVMVEAVAQHDGRFFVGPTPQDRDEMRTGLEALNTFLKRVEAGEPVKLYLTPKAINSRRTRQDKWNEACNQAREGLERLRHLQTDAEMWLQKLTRKGNANTEQVLTQITYLGLERAQETIDIASTITFPKGFGRD